MTATNWNAIAIALLAGLGAAMAPGGAGAVPVTVVFGATVSSNSGDATDGVFPPGTEVSAHVTVDSALLTGHIGGLQPASGSASSQGYSLSVDHGVWSGSFGNVNGASVRQFTFYGSGDTFFDDGNPGSGADQWRVHAVFLHLPTAADTLPELLALNLFDVNAEIAALELDFDLPLLQSMHQAADNIFLFETARAGRLTQFGITLAPPVPEPATPALWMAGLAGVLAWRRGRLRRPA